MAQKVTKSFLERLQMLARQKTGASRAAAEAEVKRQRVKIDKMTDLSDSGPFAKRLATLFDCLKADGLTSRTVNYVTDRIRETFIQYLQIKKLIVYKMWSVVDSPDPSRPDEANLAHLDCGFWYYHNDMLSARENDIADLLTMLGKIARRMKSAFLPRVIQLMVDFDHNEDGIPKDKATSMVDEFIACFKLLKKETRLLDEDELLSVWPSRPVHDVDDGYDVLDTDGMDEDEATAASREAAMDIYRKRMGDLMLPEDAKPNTPHPMEGLTDFIAKMADDAEKGAPRMDDRWHALDADMLSRVLCTNTELSYDCYYAQENGELESVDSTEETEEDELKKQIVADLRRYLTAATALAQSVGSSAYDDLAISQALVAKYGGHFYDVRGRNRTAIAADLKTFIDALKRARPVLWADCANYKPGKRNEVRLDSEQFTTLTKSSKKNASKLSRQIKTVQKTVNGEHTPITVMSKANANRVKAAIDLHYKLVKSGTKEREATTNACRKIEEAQGLGNYKSFGSFRDAVARKIADRRRRYGDKAASVSLDE